MVLGKFGITHKWSRTSCFPHPSSFSSLSSSTSVPRHFVYTETLCFLVSSVSEARIAMHHPLLTIKSERVGIVPPPPGVTPNFTNPESRGYLIVIASIVLLVLSTTVLLLRLYSRRFLVHAVNFSDCMLPEHQEKRLDANEIDAVVVGQVRNFYLLDVAGSYGSLSSN